MNTSDPATDPVLVAYLDESAETEPIHRDAIFSKYSAGVLGVLNEDLTDRISEAQGAPVVVVAENADIIPTYSTLVMIRSSGGELTLDQYRGELVGVCPKPLTLNP